MPDIIARFKGDTSDLDGKIGKASKTLMQMKADCEKVGGAFINLEKDELEFIKSLGKLETGSKSAKGTVAELTKAFTDMSAVYNRLTEEEKKDEGGKALRASLDQLKVRIKDGQKELRGIGAEIGNNGNLLEQLSGKFGVNINKLSAWGAAIGAGKVALDAMKDAFFSSEANVDEWGRTVSSASGVYQSFVSSLNNASLDSFFSNIQNVINKAREAYDALDELNTKGGITNNNEARLNYLKSKQMAIINDKSATDAQRKAAQAELAKLNTQSKQNKKALATLNNNEVKKQISLLLSQNGFKEGTSGYNEAYQKVVRSLYDRDYKMGVVNTGFQGGMKINNGKTVKYTDNGNRNLDNIVTDKWREGVNPYIQAVWSNLQQAEDATRMVNRFTQKAVTSATGGKGTTTSKPEYVPLEGSIDYYQKLAQETQKTINAAATDAARASALALYNEYSRKIKELKEDADARVSIANGTAGVKINNAPTSFADAMETPQKLGEIKGLKDLKTTGQQTAEAWTNAANAIGSIGSALAMIEDPAMKVMGTVAQAIASVALAAGQAMAAKDTTSSGWAWIGAAASITATMISTIAAIKSATAGSFANGGVIGGNSYYGDKLYARVNSGETVLNQRQARTALDMMDSGGGVRLDASNLRLQAVVDGERLRFVLNANGKRTGRGEIAYTK